MLLKVFHAAALSVVCAEVKAGVMVDTALARSPSCAIFSACFTRSSWAKAVAATVAIIAIIIIFFIGFYWYLLYMFILHREIPLWEHRRLGIPHQVHHLL